MFGRGSGDVTMARLIAANVAISRDQIDPSLAIM